MGSKSGKQEKPTNPLSRMQQELNQAKNEEKNNKKLKKKIQESQDKNRKKIKKKRRKNSATIQEISQNKQISQMDFEKAVFMKLRNQIENDLGTFVLNQMSLSVQLFDNYELQRTKIYNDNLEKEQDLNQHLEEHTILLQNAIDRTIDQWTQFKPKHGPQKNQASSIQLQKIYIVFENIEISKQSEANYDSITPICKVDLDNDFRFHRFTWKGGDLTHLEGLKWKGYVRLKFKQSEDFEELTAENEYIYRASASGSSAYYTDSEYDYAYIRRLNTHQPLGDLTMGNASISVDSKILPNSCITSYWEFLMKSDIRDVDEDYSDNEESDTEKNSPVKDRFNKNTYYLNSKEFLCYFADLLREPKITDLLNIDLNEATYRGSSIFTRSSEIVPAIHVPHNAKNWPQCAFNFKDRKRNISVNELTNQRFQWPTVDMIKKIESFGYHVIPLAYASKAKKNPFRELEWKIVFPKAERYLESKLSNTQIKVFILVKALLKSFLEADFVSPTVDYIRNFLFWECERSYHSWPEEFLGEILLRFLKRFLDCISGKNLSDFFVVQRNVFEQIPDSFLNNIKNIITNIVANPTMHLVLAYGNLTFKEEELFPRLNYQKIYKNLLLGDYLGLKKQSIKVKMGKVSKHKKADPVTESTSFQIPVVAEGLIGKMNIKATGPKTVNKRLDEQNRRKSSNDSIDVEFFFTRNKGQKDYNEGVENLRRTNLLEIFLDNFLRMAENLIKYKSINLSIIYLNQSKRLCEIYRNLKCENGAIEFMSKREELENTIQLIRQNGTEFDPPPVPLRVCVEPRQTSMKSSFLRNRRRSVRYNSKPREYSSESDYYDDEEIHAVNMEVIVDINHIDNEK